jgi:hypothetical protein
MIYDRIIADGLRTTLKNPENKKIWKEIVFFSVLYANSANLFALNFILENFVFCNKFYVINFTFFKIQRFDLLFKYFILFVLPFIPINYFLIYYKKRYEKLIKYPYFRGKLFFLYITISVCLPTIGVIIIYFTQ